MNLQYVAVINDSQIVSWPYSVEILFIADHAVLYYTKGLYCPLSGVYHITGRRKGKGLVGPFRYDYYCGTTKDPALI